MDGMMQQKRNSNLAHRAVVFLLASALILIFGGRSEAQEAAQVGTDFWLAFPEQEGNNSFEDFELDILSEQTANYTITTLTPASTVTGTVTASTPKHIVMNRLTQITTNQVIEGRGIHVTSDAPISVIFKSPSNATVHSDDAYLVLPTPTLNTENIVVGHQETLSARGFSPTRYPSQFVILAPNDATNVVINTTCTSLSGTLAGGTVVLALNAGQTYQYRCGNAQDVTGTVVTADKPVAVFGGNRCTDIPAGLSACDYVVEEMFPVSMWRKDYLTFPLNNGTADLLRIVASRDGTVVTIDDGTATQTTSLNRGGQFNLTTGLPTHIASNQPISVAQYSRGGEVDPYNANRDPMEMLIIPTDLYLNSYRLYTPTGYAPNYLNIIAASSAVGSVQLDGNPVSGFSPLPGGAYQGVAVVVGAGQHVVTASGPMAVYSYGFALAASYGYPAGIALPGGFSTVRVIDTVSTANIDLDQSTFSKPPDSVAPDPGNNQTVIEWDYDGFDVGQIEDLTFDLILMNPFPGEDRLVHHKLELLYDDVDGNPVRTEIGTRTVHVQSSALAASIVTDKSQYGADETVLSDLSITNLSDYARTIAASVEVRDGGGVTVGPVATLSDLIFAAGETRSFPGLTFDTGATVSGNYVVAADLLDSTAWVGAAQAPFVITAVGQLTAGLTVDKLQYGAHQTVGLTTSAASGTANATLTGVSATVTITDGSAATVFTETRSLADLLPLAGTSFRSFWNTETYPPGAYAASVTVTALGGLTATATSGFTIVSSLEQAQALAGTITVDPNTIIEGEMTQLSYTVQNIGNVIDVPEATLEILVVDPDTQQAVRTLTDFVSLNAREVFANSVPFDSTGLPPKAYLFALRAVIEDVTQPLAGTGLTIQPRPNTAPIANAGPDQIGYAGQPVTLDGTGSSDPESDPITYHWAFVSVPPGSGVTNGSLTGADTATPAFTPDINGSYLLALVVNDGQLDSQADQVAVYVSPPVQIDLHPETINLKSHGGSNSVTVVLFSPLLSSFAPLTGPDGVTVTAIFSFTHTYVDKNGQTVTFTTPTTDYPAAHSVAAVDLDGDGTIDGYQLTLKIDRQLIIDGFTDSNGQLRITQPTPLTSTATGNGLPIGSDVNTAIAPGH